MILAPICSLISLSTKADAQQRHTGAAYWLLIDSICSGWLVPAILGCYILWKLLSPSVLHHTDLVAPWAPKACCASGPLHLLLLLCMHFLAEMLVLHVISLAPFFPSVHGSVQISHQADLLWPLIDGKVILPITLSPYLASFFFMVCIIPRSLQRYFKDILIYLLFSHDSSMRTWNPWQ